jgi:hypothetical protein
MALPVLVAVEDDPEVLAEVEAQLVQRYGSQYRVECVLDPDEALRVLTPGPRPNGYRRALHETSTGSFSRATTSRSATGR